MQIKSISEKIKIPAFNKSKTVANHSNPFGVSFKGNIITADVFESAKKTGMVEKIAQKGRLAMNAVVGSMNAVNQSISTRLNSIASFGRRIRECGENAVTFLRESRLIFDLSGENRIFRFDMADTHYSVKNLMKRDVSDLKTEFSGLLEARGV